MLEQTIRQGENYKRQNDRNYKPSFVSIGADTRTNSLIVSGSPSQFDKVEEIVRKLEGMKPTGPSTVRVINLKNIKSSDLKRVLDQMIENRNQSSNSRRRRR